MVECDDLLKWLKRDYPALKFRLGKKFMFRPPRSIYYSAAPKTSEQLSKLPAQTLLNASDAHNLPEQNLQSSPESAQNEQNYYNLQLLHEVGHALCGYFDYQTDVERIKIERAAWMQARGLCAKYHIYYDEEFVEAELDTYRDWLQQRSACPECGLVRYQDAGGAYHCPFCENLGSFKK